MTARTAPSDAARPRTSVRAWQVTRSGEPEIALEQAEVSIPHPAPGHVLVDVQAVALGLPDVLLCRGLYHDKPDLPFVIGGEACGTVSEIGDGVDGGLLGQRVIVTPGATIGGLLAERVVAPVDRLLQVPEWMLAARAAALFVAYQTAHLGLVRRAGLRAGETLLVHGAAGGVGSAAVQLGKVLGARVIATASSGGKAEVATQLGADVAIDLGAEDFVSAVNRVTDGRGADVVFDPVGGEIFDRSQRCVAVEGRILVLGFASGQIPHPGLNRALLRNFSIVGFRTRPFRDDPAVRQQIHDELLGFAASGAVDPLVEEVGMDEVPQALRRLSERSVCGRLVVRVGEAS